MRQGIVIKTEHDAAWVRYIRHSACKNCGACRLGRSEQQERVVVAKNTLDAKVNDIVRIEIQDGSIVFAALMAYGIPLLALIAAFLIGHLLRLDEGLSLVLGIASLGASYLTIRKVIQPMLQRAGRYELVISEILNQTE